MSDGTPGSEGTTAAGPSASDEASGAAATAEEQQPRAPEEMSVGELVFEVTDRASILLREEIELGKVEITEKVNRLLRGSFVGVVAGVFVLLALAMVMHGIAWLLNDLLFEDDVWAGFLVEAAIFLLIAVAAGLFAYRSLKRGAPPTPEMAIEEAKEIKATFEAPQ